jgi:hypothetical protein
MNSRSRGFLTRVLMLTLVTFLVLPAAGFAQRRRREARQERREDRREDRQERREERREERLGRNWDRYGNYGGPFQLRQTALNAGYNNGMEEGRKDRSRGERFDYRDEKDYQKATDDYSSRLGNKELHRRYYRQAFENGYNDGYSGY